jgi:hypothetical protein
MHHHAMNKILNIIFKVVLTLLLLMPILGVTGIFPDPTRELYNSDIAFEFITMLMSTKYINYLMALASLIAVILLWTGRTAFASLLIFPITVNIVAFHLFLDGGIFTGGAVMGNVLFLLNIYFLYQNREKYMILLKKIR